MRLQGSLIIIAIITLAVATSNCLCCDYIMPPMEWHNSSWEPDENVTVDNVKVEIYLVTLGPDPVTILPSDSRKINLSVHTYKYDEPRMSGNLNGSRYEVRLGMMGSSEAPPTVKTDTLLYLPQGWNYTVTIKNGWSHLNQSGVVNLYIGWNLTLRVNDPGDWLDDPAQHLYFPTPSG